MRRLFVLVLFAFSALVPTSVFAGAAWADSAQRSGPDDAQAPDTTIPASASPGTTIDNSFLDTERDLTECLNNSVDLPGCGRAPTQEGDRGGGLQLATFGLLGLAIAFISWRVARAIRARDAALAAKVH